MNAPGRPPQPTPLDVFAVPLDGINLIEASAGTGKTWNICGLVLRLLLERRLQVQQILVVTFTNAATAELRERIRGRIVQTLDALRGRAPAGGDPFVAALLRREREVHGLADADMAARLDQALHTFDEASIFTIHGFCQRALADTPFASAMPMKLELLTDDTEMRLEAVQDFWRRRVAGADLAPALAAHLLRRRDTPEAWARLLGLRLRKPLALMRWPAGIDDAQAPDVDHHARAHACARDLWLRERAAVERRVAEALPRLNGRSYSAAALRAAVQSWDAFFALADPHAAPPSPDKRDLLSLPRLHQAPRKGCAPVEDHPFFAAAQALLDAEQALQQALELQRLRLLRDLLDEGREQVQLAKRERRVVAFDDMLSNLQARLAPGGSPWLAAALRGRFPAALVDEFQDTDPLQFAIFRAIYGAGDAPLFLVGDPKQAIYSFRNADLHTYLQARRAAQAEYTLGHNQRSTPELLHALNGLFGANPAAFVLPDLRYHPVDCGDKPRAPLVDRTGAQRAPFQLWRLPRDAQGAPLPKAAARAAAAGACAGEIARLVDAAQRGEVTVGGRPLSGGDIAVLVRTHAQGTQVRQALAALGVASVELSEESIYASRDAEELERVLAAVLEPTRVPLLRAALATELLGLDAGELEAVSGDEARLLDVVTRFSAYHELWLRRGIGVMLRRLTHDEAVAERLLARPDGERRMTNLLHLSECLHEAAALHPAPEALVRWLQAQRRETRADDDAQLRLESDRHLVQVVTIHKSKGLEYPVVFCPFLWDGAPGPSDGAPCKAYHDDDGRLVLDFRGQEPDDEVRARTRLERSAEDLRLVYVALTRAVHRCHVVVGGYAGRGGSTNECCRGVLHWLVAGSGHAPADWLHGKPAATVAAIEAAWEDWAGAHAPHAALAPLPAGPGRPVALQRPAPHTLVVREPPRRIPSAWWIGSYSALAHGIRHEAAAVDHDLRAGEAADRGPAEGPRPALPTSAPASASPSASALAPEPDDILGFPRGMAAGDCLHAVFERADFADPSTWAAAIDAALRAHPLALDAEDLARARRQLARMLHDVLHTPLPPGFLLADVPAARRRTEMEFTLPAGRLRAAELARLLHDAGYPEPSLAFSSLEGYLHGYIDLVLEHAGRHYIVDWKGNHLGHRPADYAGAALDGAMQRHAYHLQYLLYSVALDRHLRRRLPGYRYEAHFGGVMYLFVRGVRPGWTGPDGTPTGVHAHRPEPRTLERLAALLAPRKEMP